MCALTTNIVGELQKWFAVDAVNPTLLFSGNMNQTPHIPDKELLNRIGEVARKAGQESLRKQAEQDANHSAILFFIFFLLIVLNIWAG